MNLDFFKFCFFNGIKPIDFGFILTVNFSRVMLINCQYELVLHNCDTLMKYSGMF